MIYNGDPAYAYHKLIKKNRYAILTNARMNRLKYSMGLCVYYFGVSKVYNDIALHSIIYSGDYKKSLEAVFDNKNIIEENDLNLYLYRPTAWDKTMAPEGKDSFYVLAPVPNLQAGIDWSTSQQEKFKNHLINILEKRVLPELSKNIVSEKLVSPDYFSSDLLSYHGAGFSIQPIYSQSAYFRFHNSSRKIRGLYFAGAGTHPGAGVPGVLLSAKILDEIISEKV